MAGPAAVIEESLNGLRCGSAITFAVSFEEDGNLHLFDRLGRFFSHLLLGEESLIGTFSGFLKQEVASGVLLFLLPRSR